VAPRVRLEVFLDQMLHKEVLEETVLLVEQ
jgi:hypothetical protein